MSPVKLGDLIRLLVGEAAREAGLGSFGLLVRVHRLRRQVPEHGVTEEIPGIEVEVIELTSEQARQLRSQ